MFILLIFLLAFVGSVLAFSAVENDISLLDIFFLDKTAEEQEQISTSLQQYESLGPESALEARMRVVFSSPAEESLS